jgi:dienelactone hydrolase
MRIRMESVSYTDGDARLTGFVAHDEDRSGRRPGVLVFHGGGGLDEHAQDRTRRMAELGYIAVAADLYGDDVRGRRDQIIPTIQAFLEDPRRLRQRAHAALDWLIAHALADGRSAAVGYCLGGMAALELARSGADLAAAASIHGSLHTRSSAAPQAIRARILVCHGALDPHVPTAQVTAFADEMTAAGADWQLNVYGGAMHGFTHDAGGSQQAGVAYHAVADARSSAALAAFLEDAFSSVAPS